MKIILALIVLSLAICMISGCSFLTAAPRVAHFQVRGLNNNSNEYVIVLDDPEEKKLDIPLSDRYTLRLDFNWLWETGTLFQIDHPDDSFGDKIVPLAPWMTYTLRF